MTDVPKKSVALAAINELRAELGLSPLEVIPCGTPHSSGKCPVARALFVDVLIGEDGSIEWALFRGSKAKQTGKMPIILTAFIRAFDRGEYPDLIAS